MSVTVCILDPSAPVVPALVKHRGTVYKAHMVDFPSHDAWPSLRDILENLEAAVVAVSGGVDSLLLTTLAHRVLPGRTRAVHALSPAVPDDCTARIKAQAEAQGWKLHLVESGEFQDQRYLENPVNRCYFCKSHLYAHLSELAMELAEELGHTPVVISGANTDDLGEYRPGLDAAREFGVRHPYVEAGVAKRDIRAMAREMGLNFAELPASPCLASRIYTGTRVTPEIMAAVSLAENFLKSRLNISVLRCRVKERDMLVEMLEPERPLLSANVLAELFQTLKDKAFPIDNVSPDPQGYRPGRAFVPVEQP